MIVMGFIKTGGYYSNITQWVGDCDCFHKDS